MITTHMTDIACNNHYFQNDEIIHTKNLIKNKALLRRERECEELKLIADNIDGDS